MPTTGLCSGFAYYEVADTLTVKSFAQYGDNQYIVPGNGNVMVDYYGTVLDYLVTVPPGAIPMLFRVNGSPYTLESDILRMHSFVNTALNPLIRGSSGGRNWIVPSITTEARPDGNSAACTRTPVSQFLPGISLDYLVYIGGLPAAWEFSTDCHETGHVIIPTDHGYIYDYNYDPPRTIGLDSSDCMNNNAVPITLPFKSPYAERCGWIGIDGARPILLDPGTPGIRNHRIGNYFWSGGEDPVWGNPTPGNWYGAACLKIPIVRDLQWRSRYKDTLYDDHREFIYLEMRPTNDAGAPRVVCFRCAPVSRILSFGSATASVTPLLDARAKRVGNYGTAGLMALNDTVNATRVFKEAYYSGGILQPPVITNTPFSFTVVEMDGTGATIRVTQA